MSLVAFNPAQGSTSKQNLGNVASMVASVISVPLGSNTKTDYKKELKFIWAPISKCYINYDRQRWPEPLHIKRLNSKWNLNCVTPLQARYDKAEDRYYISDGQQHGIAWILQYGTLSEVPVFYIESDDENIESEQVLGLNTGNEPMKTYFIHNQQVIMGNPTAIALENAVTNAGCQFAYRKRSAGTITNFGHIYAARDYLTNRKGVTNWQELTDTLEVMMRQWPTKQIQTDTLRGLLHIRALMRKAKSFTPALFEKVVNTVKTRYKDDKGFDDPKVLFGAVNAQCNIDIGNHKDDAEPKLASGILSVYKQVTGQDIVNGARPMKRLKMPVVKSGAIKTLIAVKPVITVKKSVAKV